MSAAFTISCFSKIVRNLEGWFGMQQLITCEPSEAEIFLCSVSFASKFRVALSGRFLPHENRFSAFFLVAY